MEVSPVADPIGTIKNIAEIVKKYNDLELMKQIIDLQQEVFDLQRENLDLRKQAEDRVHMRLSGEHGYIYRDGDETPHCPKCWEKDRKAIHLPASEDFGSYHGRICRVCGYHYKEGPRKHHEPTPRTGGEWS